MAEYFYIEPATEVSSVTFQFVGYGMTVATMPTLKYSKDKVTWSDYSWTSSTYVLGTAITVNSGERLYFKGTNTTFSPTDATDSKHVLCSTGGVKINVGGNLSSLLLEDNIGEVTGKTRCFYDLFAASDYIKVVDASNLVCDVMGDYCYTYAFYQCIDLINSPQFPVTTLANYCYYYMFVGCNSLSTIPELPATTLANNCYYRMFYGCTSIKLSTTQTGEYRVPYRIPTTGTGTTGTSSLTDMFTGTGGTFTGTPTINTIYYSYAEPFYIEAVESTTITLSKQGSPTVGTCKYGIDNMSPSTSYTYGNTISLTAGQRCYFNITESTTDFTVSNYLYFTSTGKIKCGGRLTSLIGNADSIPRNYCFTYLFYNCTTLVDASNLIMCNNFNSKTHCYYSMFYRCTSLIQAPSLPATTLTTSCYNNMFFGCTSLVQAPALPATTLTNFCYFYMFHSCTSLAQAPELPATTLANNCYYSMFKDCTSLTQIPELPATTLTNYCYYSMFKDCTSLTQIPELPATTLANNCYYSMFNGCTSIKLSTTLTGEYRVPYRIPTDGTGTAGTDSLTYMFTNTGGTFTGTPSINTTYYLWKDWEVTTTVNPEGSGTITDLTGYDVLDYIQSSGSQYIDTNVNDFVDFKVELEASNFSGSDSPFFGAYTNWATNSLLLTSLNSGFHWYGNLEDTINNINPSTSTKYKVTCGYNIFQVDNYNVSTSGIGRYDTTFKLFWGGDRKGSYKLYSCKIYNGASVLRDFIPAKRLSDQAVGLLDKVNNVFYANAGSGTFTYGSVIGTYHKLTATPNPTYSFTNWLLKGYTQLEYIESSGAQYIDTGKSFTDGFRVETKVKMNSNLTLGLNGLLGAHNSSSPYGRNTLAILYHDSYGYKYRFALGQDETTADIYKDISAESVSWDIEYEIVAQNFNGNSILKFGDIVDLSSANTWTRTSNNLYIFAQNNGSAAYSNSKYRLIGSMKIYSAMNKLEFNFIPVIRQSDGAIGLLDLVHLEFYGNSGTGTFIGGPIKEVA